MVPILSSYVNSEIVPNSEARISPFDLGFLRGAGVFELLRTYKGRPAFLKEHLERLRSGCEALGIPPISDLHPIIQDLLEECSSDGEITLRIIVTKGVSSDGMHPLGPPSLLILTSPLQTPPTHYYEEGIHACTASTKRALPEIKSLNYLSAVLAIEDAETRGAKEALYTQKDGSILEGATSNFFGVKGETLITADAGILPGITRKIILSLAKSVELRAPKIEELDEAFLTSSVREVMPIVAIDGKPIGNKKPGPLTKRLRELFQSALDESFDKCTLQPDRV